ncbi:4-(cytidine 5'-diphospho)-2-C-methyl-D-erythritol kinase [Helicobacter sp. 16-1353]|uniref:4-(cytidine 5'-diphospho)-2-C-methyl-D-erythritol kinase n=1 Tax=Helicobacter sp. 16-1353 TaxID=2004996 RepID=UPI000DCC5C0F|nr:4-(cytidine 5'-diphospho)-2-C-methyl-D-erythritol kinase [Helicobacter sp. 16-1353]RAX53060.1 4-(cytidine 5'-diphospho)-2-C-methyl-D-erythritol kinase [Helicobacter sp. 16-1353]
MTNYYISYPKINICFKILGFLDNGYCDIYSRYMKVTNTFFDSIVIKDSTSFKIYGNCQCSLESNTIFKAKEILKKWLLDNDNKKAMFLENFIIDIDKKIPIFAGLGGGSSNAGTYLLAMNEILELDLPIYILGRIASNVGADVSFFVYDVNSANVSGIGDKIVEFKESIIDVEIVTPNILCETKAVFDEFRANFKANIIDSNILNMESKDILKTYNIFELNDLFAPALNLYPELKEFIKDGYYFSGSGSSFFKLKNNIQR